MKRANTDIALAICGASDELAEVYENTAAICEENTYIRIANIIEIANPILME